MITAEDFVLELNDIEENKNFKLATVTSLFANKTAKVKFDGEDVPSEKQYAYLANYSPKVDDRVMLAVTGGTYVILGKINYNATPTGEVDTSKIEGDIVILNGKVTTIQGNIVTINGSITNHDGRLTSMENLIGKKITSSMIDDNNGNMNIDYMYVDPSTGQLRVRRKNGVWTFYNRNA